MSRRSWDTGDEALRFLRGVWARGEGERDAAKPDAERRFAAWLREQGVLSQGEPRADKPWVAGAGRSLQTTSLDAIGLERLEAAGQVISMVQPKERRKRRPGKRRSRSLPAGYTIAA